MGTWQLIWASVPVLFVVELGVKYWCWVHRSKFMIARIETLNTELEWSYSENYRSALGFLSFVPYEVRRILYAAMGVLVVLAAVWASRPGRRRLTRFGVACYVCGGFGNLVDRALVGFVGDYIKFQAFYSSWSVYFNLSDLWIDVAIGIMIYCCYKN